MSVNYGTYVVVVLYGSVLVDVSVVVYGYVGVDILVVLYG